MSFIDITETTALVDLLLDFIRSKGIHVLEEEFDTDGFLPGMRIQNGNLLVNRNRLKYPGDLLHEAGHIAVVPTAERNQLNDNVLENRPGSEGEEMAVLLWSYAAALELQIPLNVVFHDQGYKGDARWLIEQFEGGNYIGLPLLVWMGMAENPGQGRGFPKMIRWLR